MMRIPFAAWLVVGVVLVLSAGVVAAERYRRDGSADQTLVQSEEAVRVRDAVIASLRAELSRRRDAATIGRITTEAAQAELRFTKRLLADTSARLRHAQETIDTQQGEQQTLRVCLSGALLALQAMANGDNYSAMRLMMTVDVECRASQRLLTPTGEH